MKYYNWSNRNQISRAICSVFTVVAVFVVFSLCSFFFFFLEKYVWTYSDVVRAFPPGFQVIKVIYQTLETVFHRDIQTPKFEVFG